ncbi:MAG: BACON domain-containing protein [Candidatus Paceibacterota bacterium]|jgi:hypothetical protein
MNKSFSLWALVALIVLSLALVACGGGECKGCKDTPPPCVTCPSPAPTVDLTADATNIAAGESTVLRWTSSNATSCSASDGWSGVKATAGSESTGALASTRTYTLTCTGSGGSTADSVTVVVTPVTPVCNYNVPDSTPAFECAGGNGSIVVGSNSGCSWTATSHESWITIVSGHTGSANGTVTFTVANNATGATRTGSITIENKMVLVTQTACPAPTCNYSVPPETPEFSWKGATSNGSLVIGATAGCSWTAASLTPGMIAIVGNASGVGTGSPQLTVAGNDGAARVGKVRVTGEGGFSAEVKVPQEAHP